jgi:PmbA protein
MKDVARKIVDMALKLGADEAEIFMIESEGKGFSIEKNSVSSLSGGLERGLGIRVIKDRKPGFAFCTEETKAEESIQNALSLSRLAKESDFTFPEPQSYKEIENIYDEKILKYTPEEALDGAVSLIDSVLEVDPDIIVTRGGVGFGSEHFVIANSKGLEVEGSGTDISASVGLVLKKDGMSTGFEDFSSRVLNIDFQKIGKAGAQLALDGQNPKKIETKDMTVVFTPNGISNFLEYISAPALYGEAVYKGESVYSNKLGEKVASEGLTLIDDGGLPGGLNSEVVDDEGVPSKRNVLIEDGILKGYLFTQSSAIEHDAQSTASAMRVERLSSSRNYKSPPTVKARNIVMEGKKTKVEELISEVSEGVLVHDVLGAHTSNPVSGDFSVTSSILFKIEKGEIAYPVKSAMLGGNFHDCLKDINAIGDDHKMVSGGLSPIAFFIPTVSFEGIRVTG